MMWMKRAKAHLQRGAALVESAVVMTYLLGVLFAGVQMAEIGYYQLAMDQGASAQARLTGLGYANTGTDINATVNPALIADFPNLKNVTLGSAKTEAPVTINTQSVSYNFGNPAARTGGFSFSMPMQQLSSIKSNANLLHFGFAKVTLNATAVEAAMAEFCPHFCLVTNGLPKATLTKDSVNYFTAGDNTTPYYIGYHYMISCDADPTADLSQPAYNTTWNTCSSAILFRALGVGAHLDQTNSSYKMRGESLDGSYTGFPTVPPAADKAGPFFETWCHRNYYVAIALILQGMATPTYPRPAPPTAAQIALNPALATFATKTFGYKNGVRNPGQTIYGATGNQTITEGVDQTGTGGWDATQLSLSSETGINFSTTLTPWWGCGAL